MPKITLTEIAIRRLPSPKAGQKTYWDKSMSGFGLRLSQGGARTWIVVDPRTPLRTRQTIGRYPVVGLKDARTAAKRVLAERTLGKYQPVSISWDEAKRQYLANLKGRRRFSTWKHYKRFLDNYFRFGEMKARDVTTANLADRLDKLADRKGEQRTAHVIVNVFLNWCERRDYVTRNPMRPVQAPKKGKSRTRVLHDDELKAVWRAAGDLGTYGQLVRCLILCGQRRTETASLTPKMDRGDRIVLPEWLTKNGREHTFPIGPMTRAILDARTGPLHFPAAGTVDTVMSGWSKMKKRLDKLSGATGWTLHDLRRTFRTNCARLGIPKDVAKRYINHAVTKSGDMDEVYDQYTYLPEMRVVVEKYEPWLQAMVA